MNRYRTLISLALIDLCNYKLPRNPEGSFTLERSRAERRKDHNKATAVKLQRSNAAQYVDMLH